MFGIPQPEAYHPEVDTGTHVMMVIDIAKKHFNKPLIAWAALLHDLGRGVTPKERWP
ncbi:MAG: HD domain-containing protein [Pseudomonadales bacterium]|nr:HD domain-containing protein [Pseudomonadales bacterium]